MKSFIWGLTCAAVMTAGAGPSAAVPAGSGATVGLISKVIQDVTHKQVDTDWQKAKKGEPLVAGDRVKTGEKSIAILKFLDNSLVRVRELSELSVNGKLEGNAFLKSVDLQNGVVGFSIQKQRPQEEFRFTSPTSVASIRGTGGLFSASDSSDVLTVIEGTVTLLNRSSGESMDVSSGFTGISMPDGSVQIRQSTPEERMAAESATNEASLKKLELELHDNQGKTRRLHLEIKE
jgi:hypothetical protein